MQHMKKLRSDEVRPLSPETYQQVGWFRFRGKAAERVQTFLSIVTLRASVREYSGRVMTTS